MRFLPALLACLFLGLIAGCSNPAGSNPKDNPPTKVTLTTVEAVAAYIADAVAEDSDAGKNVTSPIILPVIEINLADSGGNGWADLLDVIAAAGIFVSLDLSGCTMGEGVTEFDPDYTISTGKNKIVSLVLPDTAASIKAGTSNNDVTFRYFGLLKSVAGGAVTVGDYAFYGLSLNSVSFPAAKTIGDYAFYQCASLSSVSFPAAQSIGFDAFYNCTGLTEVSLSAVQFIGNYAFGNCTKLSEVSFPAATEISNQAFAGCTGLSDISFPAAQSIGEYAFSFIGTGALTVTLGGEVPSLGKMLFYNIASKTVIVRVPNNEAWSGIISDSPYYETDLLFSENWGNGFRGNGWTGTGIIGSGYINNKIWLTVEAITEE
jgi:hypothetical protein